MSYLVSCPLEDKYLPDEWFDQDPVLQHKIMSRDVWRHFRKCSKIPPEQKDAVPTQIVVVPQHGFWPDIFPIARASVWAVSDKFRKIVESVEPDVHEFIPLSMINLNGDPSSKSYFMLHIRRQLTDFVDLELSEHAEMIEKLVGPSGDQVRIRLLQRRGSSTDRLVFRKSVVCDHHLWKGGGGQFNSDTFFSDELAHCVLNSDLTKMQFEAVEEA